MKNANTTQPELVDVAAGTVDTVPTVEVLNPTPVVDLDPDPAPPKRGPGRPRRAAADPSPKVGRPSNSDRLAKSLADQYVALGQIASIFAPTAGAMLIERSDVCAQSLASWADANPKIRKALERVNTGAGALSVLIVHAPIFVAIYADLTRPAGALDAGDGAAVDLASALFAGMPQPAFR